ncbi:MAG: AMP-binding protein [Luteolibacter sp.]
MDATLLTSSGFWKDTTPLAMGAVPIELLELQELSGHVLFETSGSSGTPKWVALSKAALLLSAAAVNRHLQVTAESSWGLVLPLHHVGGFGVCARAFEAGCHLEVFGKRWQAAAFTGWLLGVHVTHTALVPTQIHDLVKARLRAPGTLKAIVVGGGHLDVETGQAARDLGWPVLASYGMTEAASQIATQTLDQLKAPYQPAPIPLLPIWRAEISSGDILSISGPALFSGYVLSESDSNPHPSFVPRVFEWHATTDQCLLDQGGITPLGRADALVKVLGELVDPELIERELVGLSRGELVPGSFVIIAVTEQRMENLLVPVFESSNDAGVVASALARYQKVAPGFRRLQPAIFIEKIPRSDLGKPLRKDLADICNKTDFT